MPPNGPAIWRAERLIMILWIILAKEPACRGSVLPDAASGHPEYSGWYFSHKVVTSWTLTELKASVMGCKEGEPAPLQRSASGGSLFAVRVQTLLSITRVALKVLTCEASSGVQIVSEPEICQGSRSKS